MMRSIIISLLFFFGPALMMFVLRKLFLIARIWLRLRDLQRQEDDVIDITPHKQESPSMVFKMAAIIVGLTCAFLAWQEMNSEPEEVQRYVPAHMDDQGRLVPGSMVPLDKAAEPER